MCLPQADALSIFLSISLDCEQLEDRECVFVILYPPFQFHVGAQYKLVGWMDGWMDGQMFKWMMDGWMDGWKEGRMDVLTAAMLKD